MKSTGAKSDHSAMLHIYTDGVVFNPQRGRIKSSAKDSVKPSHRGKVEGFSSASCRRLKAALMKMYVPGCDRVAITYTMPGKISPEDWRLLIKRWRQNLLRYGLGCIWRIELQRRGTPHLHIVGYARDFKEVGGYWLAWVRACDSLRLGEIPLTSYDGFLVYGYVGHWVKGTRWYAYLSAHTAKRKSSQLGWLGRQWGIVNRDLFKVRNSRPLQMSRFVSVRVCRALRRMYHYDSFDADVFGSRQFFGCASIERLVSYYQAQ